MSQYQGCQASNKDIEEAIGKILTNLARGAENREKEGEDGQIQKGGEISHEKTSNLEGQ
jgi:hypothetical protein